MIVCKNCLMAIESHEGPVFHRHIDYTEYEGSTVKCEWCEEEYETSLKFQRRTKQWIQLL